MTSALDTAHTLNADSSELHAPVFLAGCHKSGISLLRSPLDGHPELAAASFETHIPHSFGLPVTSPLKRTSTYPPANWSDGRERLHQLFDRYRSGRRPTAGAELSSISADSAEQHKAAAQAVEHFETMGLLLLAFLTAKVVQIARAPENIVAAIRRTYAKAPASFPHLRPIVETLAHSRNLIAQNQAAFNGRSLTISYRDLTEAPQEKMRLIASLIGIQFDDVLIRPTTLGLPWGGSGSRGRTFASVQANPSRGLSAVEIATLGTAGLLEKRACS
ncbi:MAG: sulfotransferase [Sulfitobacter sp.]|nr:sulfotransferase [Sulfitobacter sp.]